MDRCIREHVGLNISVEQEYKAMQCIVLTCFLVSKFDNWSFCLNYLPVGTNYLKRDARQ